MHDLKMTSSYKKEDSFNLINGSGEHHILNTKGKRNDRRHQRLNTELLEAVGEGNAWKVDRCLQNGAGPNATCGPLRVTACHLAALVGNYDILTLLLKKGASPRILDSEGRRPLHLAAWSGNPACLSRLLNSAVDVINNKTRHQDPDKKVRNEVLDSWTHDHDSLKRQLPQLESGSTPLHVASQRLNLDCIKLLLEAGADVEAIDDCGMTPFDVVGEKIVGQQNSEAAKTLPDVIQVLLSAGAVPKSESSYIRTSALHTAVALRSLESIALIANNPEFAIKFNKNGLAPIHLAVSLRLEDSLEVLLQNYTDKLNEGTCEMDENPFRSGSTTDKVDKNSNTLDIVDLNGNNSFHMAIRCQWLAGVEIFLESGADVCKTNGDGSTALHLAAESGNHHILEEISKVPGSINNINTINNQGETPLSLAITSRSVTCVRILLKLGADLSFFFPGNTTVYHRAAEYNCPDIIEELSKCDQYTKISLFNTKTDPGGISPLHIAALKGYTNCVKVLLSSGCDVSLRASWLIHNESTALHLAASQGHSEIVQIILDHDCDTEIIEARNNHGYSPLHLACLHNHRECIQVLLKAGADLAATVKNMKIKGKTAMDFLIRGIDQPVDFLEEQLNSSISVNDYSIQDPKCVVSVDYNILVPRNCRRREFQVLNSLLDSDTQSGQERLLLHPLVESFLILKWQKLKYWFYIILGIYAVFVMSLTTLTMALYYFSDNNIQLPSRLDLGLWRALTLLSMAIFVAQEVVHVIQMPKAYLLDWESWLKWTCFLLSTLVATVDHSNTWARHVTTLAVLFAWFEYMFLLCRDPEWGQYALLFCRVCSSVFKVLSTVLFLILGFCFAFMIQFRATTPFTSPFEALIKVITMIKNEIDYSNIFGENSQLSSPVFGRLVFLLFVFLIGIVFMNILVGVAVNEVTSMKSKGKINRLRQQVQFSSTMERIIFSSWIIRCLPIFKGSKSGSVIKIYPAKPKNKEHQSLPQRLIDAIVIIAMEQKNSNTKCTIKDLCRKMDELLMISRNTSVYSDLRSNIRNDFSSDLKDVFSQLKEDLVKLKTENENAMMDLKTATAAQREEVGGRLDRLQVDQRVLTSTVKKILHHVSPEENILKIERKGPLTNAPKLSSC